MRLTPITSISLVEVLHVFTQVPFWYGIKGDGVSCLEVMETIMMYRTKLIEYAFISDIN